MSTHVPLYQFCLTGLSIIYQVKFSELTLDMFRMLQALEREPQEDATQIYDSSPAPGMIPNENGFDHRSFRRENPHKYLLYKPTFSQFLVFLSSGFKELPINGVMLIFLSSDGCFINSKQPEDSKISVNIFKFNLTKQITYFVSSIQLVTILVA